MKNCESCDLLNYGDGDVCGLCGKPIKEKIVIEKNLKTIIHNLHKRIFKLEQDNSKIKKIVGDL